MKKWISGLLGLLLLWGCQENETATDDFSGNEMVYALDAGSYYNISGTVTFKEKKDGSTFIRLSLSGTEGGIEHPVHLHLGDLSAPDADIYALLNPVSGNTGVSETVLVRAADETPLSYASLTKLNACLKVHLAASGPDRDIILAAGNIGVAATESLATGRAGILSVCKSE